MRSKAILWLCIMGFIVLCIGGWKGRSWYQEFAKWRMATRFLKAVLNRDGQTLCELTAPEERNRLRLTPQKAAFIVDRLMALLGEVKPVRFEAITTQAKRQERIISLGGVQYLVFYPTAPGFPEERAWRVYWGDKITGKPLSVWFQKPSPSQNFLTSVILVVRLKSGFWVDFRYFIYTTCASKWGEERGLMVARQILQ